MSGFNIQKQIDYWRSGANDALETASLLIENGKILFGLFFCHLSIEKLLKSHYVRCTSSLAPKTHDLLYLSKKLDFELEEEHIAFFATLMYYQLEGRYPESLPETPGKDKALEYFNKTKEIFEWLAAK